MSTTDTNERKHLLHTVTHTRRHTHAESTLMPSKSTKIRIRWDRIGGALVVGVVLAVLLNWAIDIAIEPADTHGGVPACTDEIADAGGICYGEPR